MAERKYVYQLIGSLLVGLLIVVVTISIVTDELGLASTAGKSCASWKTCARNVRSSAKSCARSATRTS